MTNDETADDTLIDGRYENETDAESFVPSTPIAAFALRCNTLIEQFSFRTLWYLEHRPKSLRLFLGSIIGLFVMTSMGHAAHAQQNVTPLLKDEIDNAFKLSNNFNLLGNAIALAQYLFATLAAITLIINVLAYYIRNQSVRGLGQVVLTSILRLGIPFLIIGLAPTVLPTISLIGLQVADVVTNQTGPNYGLAAPGTVVRPEFIEGALSTLYADIFNPGSAVIVSPSNIAALGENIGFTIIDKADCALTGRIFDAGQTPPCPPPDPTLAKVQSSAVSEQEKMIMGYIIPLAIGIIGTFVFIAVELVIAYFQVYLILPVAAFSLGFLGSPATRQYGANYWTLVVGTLIKFVSLVFTIGLAMQVATDWAGRLSGIDFNSLNSSTSTAVGALKTAIGYSMAAFTLFYIIRVLPSLFAGLLSGNLGSADGNQAEYMTQQAGGGLSGSRAAGRPGFSGGGGTAGLRTGRTTNIPSTRPGGQQ